MSWPKHRSGGKKSNKTYHRCPSAGRAAQYSRTRRGKASGGSLEGSEPRRLLNRASSPSQIRESKTSHGRRETRQSGGASSKRGSYSSQVRGTSTVVDLYLLGCRRYVEGTPSRSFWGKLPDKSKGAYSNRLHSPHDVDYVW